MGSGGRGKIDATQTQFSQWCACFRLLAVLWSVHLRGAPAPCRSWLPSASRENKRLPTADTSIALPSSSSLVGVGAQSHMELGGVWEDPLFKNKQIAEAEGGFIRQARAHSSRLLLDGPPRLSNV
jgi:hypothetical protein